MKTPALSAYALRLLANRELGIKPPPAPDRKVSAYKRRASATHYLDGEEQREKKAIMQANEAVIVGMLIQGMPVWLIALSFGVTDEAIHKRRRAYGLPSPPNSVGHRRTPVYGHITQKDILSIEIDNHYPHRKASAKKFDPRQLFLAGID